MELIVIMGPQAVGEMTVGQALEKKRNAKLLYNHQTLDLYANFLGYRKEAFRLSDETRINLFQAFVQNESNVVDDIIFTIMIGFDLEEDMVFLERIQSIFDEIIPNEPKRDFDHSRTMHLACAKSIFGAR